MRASPEFTLSSLIPARRWSKSTAVIAALIHGLQAAAAVVRRTLKGRRRRSAWREDLPWNVGMDHLAEQAYHPWILRP